MSTTLFFRDQRTLKALEKYHGIDQFEKDAAAGQLPQCVSRPCLLLGTGAAGCPAVRPLPLSLLSAGVL